MPLDKNMMLLRAISLVEQEEEQVVELYNGATAQEVFIDFLGVLAVAKALMSVMAEGAGVPVSEIFIRTRTRILRAMPQVPEE